MSYIFGGDTGMSYEDVQRKRKVVEALRLRQSGNAPKSVGEGLNAIGQALLARSMEKKADAADEKLRGDFDKKWEIALGLNSGFGSTGNEYTPFVGGPTGSAESPEYNIDEGDPRRGMFPTGASQTDDMGSFVRRGLIDRGLPEHIADGFVMNFRDESNLDPSINERAPIVPGSRGGFGLAQWTGPRRKQLEAFAQSQGRDVSDPNLQMDFLVSELQGPESAAWSKISGSQNAGEAGAAIVNHFLRPAEEHRASRERRYMGGLMNQSNAIQLAALAQSPYASNEQKMIAQMLMQQTMQANDPLRQMQIERERLQLEQLRNPKPETMTPYQQAQIDIANRKLESEGEMTPYQQAQIDLEREKMNAEGSGVDTKGERDHRKEFAALKPVQEFNAQAQAYGRIQASAKDPSAAGDLALIFNYMKLLDPGSVVRESEFATAQNAAGVPDRIRNLFNRVQNGERLGEEQRTDFVGRSAQIYMQAEQQHEQLAEQYGLMAEQYGYDRDRTIPDFRFKAEGAPPTSPRPQTRAGMEAQNVATVSDNPFVGISDAEFYGIDLSTLSDEQKKLLAQARGLE